MRSWASSGLFQMTHNRDSEVQISTLRSFLPLHISALLLPRFLRKLPESLLCSRPPSVLPLSRFPVLSQCLQQREREDVSSPTRSAGPFLERTALEGQ